MGSSRWRGLFVFAIVLFAFLALISLLLTSRKKELVDSTSVSGPATADTGAAGPPDTITATDTAATASTSTTTTTDTTATGSTSTRGPESGLLSSVDDFLAHQTTPGEVAFNPPTEMKEGRDEKVAVRIAMKRQAAGIANGMPGNGKVIKWPEDVSDVMAVQLVGDTFTISSISDVEQPVAGGYAEWLFHVRPEASGEHDLELHMARVLLVPGFTTPRRKEFPVSIKTVRVHVSPAYVTNRFLKEKWEFLLGTLIIPLGVWFYKERKERNKTKPRGAGFRG